MRQRIWALLLLTFVVAGVHVKLAAAEIRRNHRGSSPHNKELVEAFEKRLLEMFGLQSRPKSSGGNQTISDYMWDLYKKQHRLQKGGRSTTVRCFKAQEAGLRSPCDETKALYQFQLSGIPDHEEVWAAELVVYREEPSSTEQRPPIHRVQVFDVIRPASAHTNSIQRLVDTRIFRGSTTGTWESLDVLPAIQRWRSEPSENHGLQLELASSINDSHPQHVRLKRSMGEDPVRWSQFEPLLVIYSRDRHDKDSIVSRTRRSITTRKHRRKGRKDNCRRHALYVDFSDVGWNDWIIAPPGYNAYFCHGDCPFPLPDHLNTTNHAIVQTLVNSANPAAVPRACCVPTELSPISMLYKDKYDNVVLKNYQDMVVEGCGCR